MALLSRTALGIGLSLAGAACLRAEVPKLSRALPGTLHVGALVNLADFLATFPELGTQGFVAEQLDALAARGVPDPRGELHTLALGAQLGKPHGVTEGVALGTSQLDLVAAIRQLAEDEGIPLTESAYRGVTFVTGTYNQKTSRFGDPTPELVLIAYDQAEQYQAGNACVDTLQGITHSFWDEYGKELTPGVYLTARMTLSAAVRQAVAGTPLNQLQHIVSAWVDLTAGAAGRVSMNLRARATSTLKAMVAMGLLKDKLAELAQKSQDPAVKRLLLEQTQVSRSGATLMVDTDAPRDDFVVGLLALEELLRGQPPKPGW